jgi:hypothetical protein
VTCLREVIADLRPNAKARADFEQFQLAAGVAPGDIERPARTVTHAWRSRHALAPARVERDGIFVELDNPRLREQLADAHAALLAEHGMPQLDIFQRRSKDRPVTQAISRSLYERGVAGLLFRSNLDDKRCLVLFEGRARLRAFGRAKPAPEDIPDLLRVCAEYGLLLELAGATDRGEHRRWRP